MALAPAVSSNAAPSQMTMRGWAILLILCGALFLEGLDISMMGVALPAIQADLGMTTSSLQWVVSAYVLGYGGFMLLGGRAADLLGRRRMFLTWLAVFVGFSGLGGLATESWMIILARFVTGVAAAFMTPAGLSIITTSYPEGPLRNRALLIYSGIGAAGFSLGMVAGGILTEFAWRWVFFAPVLIAAGILVAGARLIPDQDGPAQTRGFDIAGAVLVTLAMLLVTFTIVNVTEVSAARTAATGLAAAAALALFVAVERRTRTPLVRLGILRSGPLVRANLGALLFSGSFMGFQFLVVLYLQQVLGWSALETGLALVIAGIDVILAPTVTPWLIRRFGVTRVILAGTLVASVAYALFLRVDAESSYVPHMLPTVVLIGVAFALAYGPLTIAATDGIAPEEQGLAGGLLYTSWQFGAALGLAAVTASMVSGAAHGVTAGATMDDIGGALAIPVVTALLSFLVVATGLRRCGDCPEVGEKADSTATFANA